MRSAVTGRRVHGSSSGSEGFQPGAFFQSLDGQRALADGGTHDVGAEDFADDVAPAESAQARGCQHNRVILSALDLGDAGIDVAANGLNIEIGPDAAELRYAPQRTGADLCAEFDIAQFAADDGVARIGPLRKGGDGEAFGQLGGQIFQAVDGKIDAFVEQGFLDLAGEEAFAAGSRGGARPESGRRWS